MARTDSRGTDRPSRRHRAWIRVAVTVALLAGATVVDRGAAAQGRTARSLRAAFEIDRDGARLVAYTVKPGPPVPESEPRTAQAPGRLEVKLGGDGEAAFRRGLDADRLCLAHGPGSPPHVEGDTIRLHRDWFVVELPERSDLDRVEIAWYPDGAGTAERVLLGSERLGPDRFLSTAGGETWAGLAFARETPLPPKSATGSSAVRWPEDLGDPELIRVYGDPAEGASRINITLVPDGYTYADKARMEADADRLVAAFRARTPFREHDPFINYTLVYAYSAGAGTDQCDCGTVADTAMGTGFPGGSGSCGSAANRCLYYGGYCDADSSANIALAELRAPFHDTTLVMVNTDRYGGCAGARAVYAAGNPAGVEIALHEIGHSLAGLADEYGGSTGCSIGAGEVNTSTDGIDGAWAEWIDELGPPVEGGQYYEHCVYRPSETCQMRSLAREFCPVCRQHWAGLVWSHPRVRPGGPIVGQWPGAVVETVVGRTVELAVETRLPVSGTVNTLDWFVTGPGATTARWISGGAPSLVHAFDVPGTHRVTARVVGDAEVIKPERHADNVGTAAFDVVVLDGTPPAEVAAAGAPESLRFADGERLEFGGEDAGGGTTYNVYRGELTTLGDGTYGACLAGGLTRPELVVPEAPPHHGWFFLASASNAFGEGPLGYGSGGTPRAPLAPCD